MAMNLPSPKRLPALFLTTAMGIMTGCGSSGSNVDTGAGTSTCAGGDAACLCTATGYAGVPVSTALNPATDTLLNDITGFNDGTFHDCVQNTTVAQEAACISVTGRQTHLLGATPSGSSLLLNRSAAGACLPSQIWLFDGTFRTGPYTGVDITTDLQGLGFDTTEGQRLTLTPDGLTVIGRTPAGVLRAATRSAPGPMPYTFSATSTAWFDPLYPALGRVEGVALSTDGKHLYLAVAGASATHWEASRAATSAAFGSLTRLEGAAPGLINDGTFEFVTGATEGGRTLLVTKAWKTYRFTRPAAGGAYSPADGGTPLDLWYAHPVQGCGAFIGTMSPGGCTSEGVGWFAVP
jgi:hypothetical protein